MATDDERLVVLLEARIRDFERNMQKASGTAAREYGQMRKESKTATQAMEADMNRTTSRINQALATVSSKVGAMASAFGPAAAAVGVGATALAGFLMQARNTAREIASIGDEAKRAGIGIKAFQELRYVADQNRIGIDALTDGIKELNLRADEFIVTGTGSGAESFKRLGFNAADLAKKLKDPSALFTEIIGKMEKLDRAAQIRIADELFGGTGGEQFVQLLEQGEAGIKRTIQEANNLGIVMDEQMIAKAAEVDRKFGMITTTVSTKLKGAIVEAASALNDFMDSFRAVEERQDFTIKTQLGSIFERRQELQDRIKEMQEQDASPLSFFKNTNEIKLAQAELAKLTDEAAKLKDILDRRAGLLVAAAATTQAVGQTATATQQLGDGLDYVTRNGGAATTTVDTFGKSVADLRGRLTDSVAGLRTTVDTFGQSEGAIAAARFQADAMADALRAAKAAGKESIDPELVSFIKGQAAEYGALTNQIAASTKAEEERQRVAEKAKDRADKVSAFESDLAFERSILGLPQAEQQVRQTLRGLDVDFESFEGQRLAAGIRYNESLKTQQGELQKTGNIVQEMGDIFSDIFSSATRDGESFFASVIRGIAGLGNQLAAAGAKRLFGNLFPSMKGANDSGGISGYFTSGARIAANGGGSLGYVPTPTSRPEYVGQAAAAVSGQVMSYAGRFNSSVDSRLLRILNEASSRFDMRVEAISGLRPGDSRFHGKGVATDVQIYGANGKALSNYQDGSTFRVYERFAQLSKKVQQELFPEMEGMLRWGGYFSGGKGKYGALDTMHFDLAGKQVGMGGGTWDGGLSAAQRRIWGGAQSVGMGSAAADQRTVAKGVTQGLTDYSRRSGAEGYDAGRFDAGGTATQQMTRGQAGFGAAMGLAGIFGAGAQSGNPLMGGISGLMGGVELGKQFGGALGLGAAAGPLGAPVGRALPLFKRKEKVA